MRRSVNVPDLVAGLLLIAVALLALWLAWPLRTGTSFRMGPGYLPQALCYLQIALGLMIVAQSFFGVGVPWEPWVPRPIIGILASVTFFALTIERFGLVVAVFGLTVLACLTYHGTRIWEAAALGALLAGFSVLVFVTGLQLPIPIWKGL
ncbi:tripartite tricarboxylate transporter TctB family protein [Starkeya sp. ORNL1]|uniref:tripartite tricarboxylate transporter TctB family protein n=1 Tax=Starkeya sp. ORNL1 TaxID=2709380 RepID=UPI001463DA7D|nr:tripartite tricarboxylate transporter TctB family protein [Starkeya sp. ORNL1]QJP15866.1 tripartite tricarboxylate transporter TctB family protein [Starkeya sp. ORNL1]